MRDNVKRNTNKLEIKVISKKPLRSYGWAYLGRIYFNDCWETFTISDRNWSLRAYEEQWRQGIDRIKTHDTSCLITSFETDRKTDAIIWMYILYKKNNEIRMQQRLLMNQFVQEDNFPPLTEFNRKNCYEYINPDGLGTVIEGDDKVSEWIVTIE